MSVLQNVNLQVRKLKQKTKNKLEMELNETPLFLTSMVQTFVQLKMCLQSNFRQDSNKNPVRSPTLHL